MRPFRSLSLLFSSALLAMLPLMGASAQAFIFKGGETVMFNTYVTEDVYLGGETITIQKDVEGDLWVAGGDVTVNGAVSGDVLIFGGNVLMNGAVKDDVRVAGGTLTLNGNVDGDLVVVSGTVDVAATSTIQGDAMFLTGVGNFYGTLNKSLTGYLGRLVIGGKVNGNVNVHASEELVLLESGVVSGNLIYFAPQKMTEFGGTVAGEITYNEIQAGSDKFKENLLQIVNRGSFAAVMASYFSLLLIGILALMFMPRYWDRMNETLKKNAFKSMGVGFFGLILMVVIMGLSAATVIGAPFSLILLALMFLLIEFGRIAAGYFMGGLLLKHPEKRGFLKHRPKGRAYLQLAAGLLLIKLFMFIPYVGWVLRLALFFAGVGALILTQRETHQRLAKERLV